MTRVVFLAGLGRSGTTLLERALAELPGVEALGEVNHLWRRSLVEDELCGCGEPFSRCPHWQAVGERAFRGWDNVDVGAVEAAQSDAMRLRHIPRLARGRGELTRAADVVADHHRRVYEAASAVTGARVVVDSSKHPALAYVLRRDPSVDLRVVHVVRDPRGVAYSWTKQVERPERRGGSERWMTRYSPSASALLWLAHNSSTAMLRVLGTRVLLVRYESFVREPAQTLAAVARFADLELDAGDLAFVEPGALRLRPAHTASGNPLRFTLGRLEIRVDEAWRTQLPRRDNLLVSALTYPQLAHYGFAGRRRTVP
ncbi:MAG TPA: sulfotransferase [Gaiellaceae bacterium]|nr:sulfotransferase [Gaiellaceae bacterium]